MTNAGKTVVEGEFTANGQSDAIPIRGRGSLTISGGVATTTLERSSDEGDTWLAASKNSDGDLAAYTTSGAASAFNGVIDEPEANVLYRLNCVWTSGTVLYRMVI